MHVRPRVTVPIKGYVGHHFISTHDWQTTSKYGWVSKTAPFSMDEFIAVHLQGVDFGDVDRAHVETMLLSIARLQEDTPVAAGYSLRGVETKRMEFTVHRVVFHAA